MAIPSIDKGLFSPISSRSEPPIEDDRRSVSSIHSENDPCALLFLEEMMSQNDFDLAVEAYIEKGETADLIHKGKSYEVSLGISQRSFELSYQIPAIETLQPCSFSGKVKGVRYLAFEKLVGQIEVESSFVNTWNYPEHGRFIHPCLIGLSDFVIKERILRENAKDLLKVEKRNTALLHLKFLSLRKIALDLIKAVSHLHNHSIVYREITPNDIYLTEEGAVLKFGQNMRCLHTASGSLGYPRAIRTLPLTPLTITAYSSPLTISHHIKKSSKYDKSIDLFSLGKTLYYLATGSIPSDSLSYPNFLPKRFKELLDLLMAPTLERRASSYQLLSLPFFIQNVDDLFNEYLTEVISSPMHSGQYWVCYEPNIKILEQIEDKLKEAMTLSNLSQALLAHSHLIFKEKALYIQALCFGKDDLGLQLKNNYLRSYAIIKNLPFHPRIIRNLCLVMIEDVELYSSTTHKTYQEDVDIIIKQTPEEEEVKILFKYFDAEKEHLAKYNMNFLSDQKTLHSLIRRDPKEIRRFTQTIEALQTLCKQMLEILIHLHHHGLVHRSLSIETLAISSKTGLMLLDLSQLIYHEADHGYPLWTEPQETPKDFILLPSMIYAPEHVDDSLDIDHRCDLFCAAAIILSMATSEPICPWPAPHHDEPEKPSLELLKGLARTKISDLLKTPELLCPSYLPEPFKDMMLSLLKYNPHHRICATEWSYHPFLRRKAQAIVNEHIDRASGWTGGL